MKPFWKLQQLPQSKGYNLWKIATLAQRLKLQTKKKQAKNISPRYCSCSMKKRASKKHLVFEKWDRFENCQKWQPNKGHRLCKIVTLGQKMKVHKNMLKTFLQHIPVILCNKDSKKQLIFDKWEHFENCQRWPPRKGYRLCEIVTLGKKKMHQNILRTFVQQIAVVLCKKRLEKTPSIRKMRSLWKLPKMTTKQRL